MLIISSQFAIILFHSSMVLGKKELLWTDVLHDTGVRDRLLRVGMAGESSNNVCMYYYDTALCCVKILFPC